MTPAAAVLPTRKRWEVSKRARCFDDAQLVEIARAIFERGETMSAIASEVGVSASYLSRALRDARARCVFRVEVVA